MVYVGLGIMTLIFALVLVTEYRMERNEENYSCYRKMEFRRKASGCKCPGYDKSCKGCQYKKNFDREVGE
jgi:hypothetical protein